MMEFDDELQALYRVARPCEQPTRADRHAVRRAVSLATAVSIGSVSTLASATGAKGLVQLLVAGKFLTGLMIGAAVGTAITTASYVTQTKTTAPVSAPTFVRAQNSTQVARARGVPATPAVPLRPVKAASLPSASVPSASPRAAVRRENAVASAVLQPRPDGLMQESAELAKVQSALSRGEPEMALVLLETQQVEFSSGQLAEERAAAQVLALCAAGRSEAAALARARFMTIYAGSPLVKRVSQSCRAE